jgi:xanthine dehydrogenase YagS FAD-binding subunit
LELLRPESPGEAVAALGNGSAAIAGGTELVPLLRDRIVRAERLVDLAHAVPRGIEPADGRTTIGAGATLADLEVADEVPQALREACAVAASPQLRAMGTIGGNLLQATRCWYWRLSFPCFLHGGARCHAREGEHREHAIFGNDRCASAHPSDPAAALLALGATLRTDRRELAVADLYRLPTEDDRRLTTLAPDELILELDVPTPAASVYLKAMDRRVWAFPLVGVAAARSADGTRLALSGVAPIPWLLAAEASLEDATPLPATAYKLELARALVARALDAGR